MNLQPFAAGKAEITSKIQYQSSTQQLPKLKVEKSDAKVVGLKYIITKKIIKKIQSVHGGD